MIIEKKIINKPWGHEIIWAQTDNYVGKILVINAEQRLSKQFHEQKEETIYVLNGELTIETEEENTKIITGQSFHIKPKTIHRFCAYNGSVELMEVSTPEINDVIRIEDDYKRV